MADLRSVDTGGASDEITTGSYLRAPTGPGCVFEVGHGNEPWVCPIGAGEVILQPLNGVLLGTAIPSEESISPPTPTSTGHVRHVGPWARVHASRRTVATCGRLGRRPA